MDRHILHCDLNNFYASVECVDHPELAGLPVVVGGREDLRKGIVLAKNQLAKSFGITTGDTMWMARQKCPQVVAVTPHFDRYFYFSKKVKEIYLSYTQRVESFGIDECWLDITGCEKVFGTPLQVAQDLRRRIREETGLTISVGVSFNKIFAKLGSDYKKPDAVTVISPENFRQLVWPLPVDALVGVGRATGKAIHDMGLHTVGCLAGFDRGVIRQRLGINGERLWNYANGIDDTPVLTKEEVPVAKSVSRSITLPKDISGEDQVWKMLLSLSEEVLFTMRKILAKGKGVELTIRDNELKYTTLSCKTEDYITTSHRLASYGMDLFRSGVPRETKIRAIGIRVSKLYAENALWQMNFFTPDVRAAKEEVLERKMEDLRKKFGEDVIQRAVLLENVPYRIRHKEESQPTFGVKV